MGDYRKILRVGLLGSCSLLATFGQAAHAQDAKPPIGSSTQPVTSAASESSRNTDISAATTTGGSEARSGATASPTLGEITVTARRQSESLLNVPVAVTAIGSAELQRTGVTDLTSIAQLAPQVILAQADSGTGASFSIRGLGTSFLDPGFDQSVLVNLDGAQISRGQIITTAMFDLQQVEVLKGPQALFFGKNSPAGVVSISSVNPTDRLEGYMRAGYEFDAQEKYVEAAVAGPITNTLKGRIAIRASELRGWLDNVAEPLPSPLPAAAAAYFPESAGAAHRYGPGYKDIGVRSTLIWQPTSRFTANLKLLASRHSDNGTSTQQFCDSSIHAHPISAGGIPDPLVNCAFDDKITSVGIPSQFVTPAMVAGGFKSSGQPYSKVNALLPTLNMNYKMDHLSLASITTYLYLQSGYSNNQDYSSYGLANSALRERDNNFSQELRLTSSFDAPINFTLGGYYEKTHRQNFTDSLLEFLGPDPATGRYDTFANSNYATGRTLSAFGQLRWDILDNLELAGGVRYTEDRRSQTVFNNYIHSYAAAFGLVPVGQDLSASLTSTNYSPEVTLTYKITPNATLYAAYKTGYKPGGFPASNLFVQNFSGAPVSAQEVGGARYAYDPEKAKGGEVGFKAKLAHNTVRIETTIYYYDYTDLQQSFFNPPTFSYIITNADARVQGVEISGEWLVVPQLRLNGSIAYNDAKYTSFPSAGCYPGQIAATGCVDNGSSAVPEFSQNLTGGRLPRAPRLNVLGGFVYDFPMTHDLKISINGDVNYTSGYITQENQSPFAYQSNFALANGGVRAVTADDHYELALIGRNLADKRYILVSTPGPFSQTQDQIQASTPRGREIRLQATARF